MVATPLQEVRMKTLLTFVLLAAASQFSPVLGDPEPQGTNTKLFTGNQALDSGALGFGLGVGAAVIGSGLINGAANSNPCGKRRRRSAQNKDSRFFLGGGGNNCNYPSNNNNHYPSNNHVSSYPSNNHNSHYPSNNYNSCQCTSLSWTDHYGVVNGNCRSQDHGKGTWCYTTGWNSGCRDLHSSKRYPNNPWSYQACNSNSQWGK